MGQQLRGEDVRENPKTGAGNTELQEEYREQFQRPGMREIHLGQARRRLLSVAVMPTHDDRGRQGTLQPVMPGRSVDFVLMWDRPRKNAREKGTQIETAVIRQRGRLQGQQIVIGSDYTPGRDLFVDFAATPSQPYQRMLALEELTALQADVWPGGGELCIRARGDFIDICVGWLPGLRMRAIMYTLPLEDFDPDDPSAVLCVGKLPIENAQEVFGNVDASTTILRMRRKCRYLRACVGEESRRPLVQQPHEPVLSAFRHQLFATLNRLIKVQNDVALGVPGAPEPLPVAPWCPRPMLALPKDVARCVASLADFRPSEVLKTDLLFGLGPEGDFRVRAEHSGTVASIEPQADQPLCRLVYEGGAEQLFPATAEGLPAAGETVTAGQVIGRYCGRDITRWEEFRSRLGLSSQWLLHKFLQEHAIHSGDTWKGPGVLMPLAYVGSIQNQALRDSRGPLWYWDLRPAWSFQDGAGGLLLPPLPYPDWQCTSVTLGAAVQLDLSADRHGSRRRGRKRSRRSGRRSGEQSPVVS